MTSSPGAAITALAGRGSFGNSAAAADEYNVVLPPIPTGMAVMNSVLLHGDLKGRAYRIEDLKTELKRCGVLNEILSFGAFQMNHVWMATLQTPEAKQRLVETKELKVKNLRCIVIDSSCSEVRLRVHWVPFHVLQTTPYETSWNLTARSLRSAGRSGEWTDSKESSQRRASYE